MGSSAADVEDALIAFGVDAGDLLRRRKRAVQLAAEGFTAEQVELVGAHCEGTIDDEGRAVRVLCAILADSERLRAMIADLGRAATAREERQRTPEFNADGRQPPSDVEYAQRAAFARVDRDGAPVLLVANELGVTTDEVLRLVELERARRGTPAAARPMLPPDPKAAARRRQEVLSELAAHRRAAPSKAVETLHANVRAARAAREPILLEVRKHGRLNLRRVLGSPAERGALAMLEDEGLVVATSTIGEDGFASYAAPTRAEDQARIRAERRAWFREEIERTSTPAARAAAARANPQQPASAGGSS